MESQRAREGGIALIGHMTESKLHHTIGSLLQVGIISVSTSTIISTMYVDHGILHPVVALFSYNKDQVLGEILSSLIEEPQKYSGVARAMMVYSLETVIFLCPVWGSPATRWDFG